MKLKMIKDVKGMVERVEGEVFDYNPWNFEFQGKTEPQRVSEGLFVHCYGMGEFEVLREAVEVCRL